jgi:misacylated tRNA(Ala) deacylase
VTDLIAHHDAYVHAVEALVDAVEPSPDGLLVRLDRTVFYPGGGGQPSDAGTLLALDPVWGGQRWQVASAKKAGDDVWHLLRSVTAAEGPEPGTPVRADIDWERRYLLMRTHTALHCLCGVVWRDYGAQVTGGNMEPGSGRMDFEFERMSGDLVGEIEAKVNTEIAAARDVSVRFLPRDEAFAIPDLIRTKVNLLPAGIEVIRVVEIAGLDLQADGGTHVANTGEVGGIRVTGYESKGRINKRIRIELASRPS